MESKKKKLSAYYKPYKGLFLADMVFAMIGAAITLDRKSTRLNSSHPSSSRMPSSA